VRGVVLAVYVVALLMQLGGVYFVIHDAIKSRANVRATFAEEWEKLSGPHDPNDWPHIKEPVLANWITSENASGDLRRFAPIVVLLLGVVLGFVSNTIALFITK
jgi:hypothetical protein